MTYGKQPPKDLLDRMKRDRDELQAELDELQNNIETMEQEHGEQLHFARERYEEKLEDQDDRWRERLDANNEKWETQCEAKVQTLLRKTERRFASKRLRDHAPVS